MPVRAATLIHAVIVDDEKLACDELTYLLQQFPDIEVQATGSNGLEAIDLVEEFEPDLVFLDVQMPGMDGMTVIRQVREKHSSPPYFVLVTAFDAYAVEAFRLQAADYLLKPLDKDRLAETVERVRRYMFERQQNAEMAAGVPSKPALQRNKVLVKNGNRNFIVDAHDIIYATIEDGLITVVASTLEGQSNYRTIEELQSNLDPDLFWRVHRSYLVNINRIREVVPWFKSSYQLRMDDKKQTEVPVSRVQTKRLRTLLKL
ncbi:MAG TPA: LytTR family DNA-binding domain-containing protein [Bryobacteraceae bacterium]|nr:LytTR family DNA-binding domain-containing protein [Bryobacteraceae bacterium]